MSEALRILADAVEAGELRSFRVGSLPAGTTSFPNHRYSASAETATRAFIGRSAETVAEAVAALADQVANQDERAA